jgi:selenoprotein W-related protein
MPADAARPEDHVRGAHRVRITYCPRCRWLLRAAWMAQELLVTFERDLAEVAIGPGGTGIYEVRLDGDVVWSRAIEGRFPELKELKQRIRDHIEPGRGLGHSDRALDQ